LEAAEASSKEAKSEATGAKKAVEKAVTKSDNAMKKAEATEKAKGVPKATFDQLSARVAALE
jgi:hypothetical protein